MKNIFTAEKLLVLSLGISSLLLLGSIEDAADKTKKTPGESEAAAIAAEMDADWLAFAELNSTAILEISTAEITD